MTVGYATHFQHSGEAQEERNELRCTCIMAWLQQTGRGYRSCLSIFPAVCSRGRRLLVVFTPILRPLGPFWFVHITSSIIYFAQQEKPPAFVPQKRITFEQILSRSFPKTDHLLPAPPGCGVIHAVGIDRSIRGGGGGGRYGSSTLRVVFEACAVRRKGVRLRLVSSGGFEGGEGYGSSSLRVVFEACAVGRKGVWLRFGQ